MGGRSGAPALGRIRRVRGKALTDDGAVDGAYHCGRDTIDVINRMLEKGQTDRRAVDMTRAVG